MIPCPVCQFERSESLLVLRDQPILANVPQPTIEAARSVNRCTIDFCKCSNCSHHYNREFASFTYQPGYENSLGHSPSMQVHLATEAERITKVHQLDGGKTVVEIGCGRRPTFLCQTVSSRNMAIGFDPAYEETFPLPSNITIHAEEFDLTKLPAKVDLIIARHVLEHLADPVAFLKSLPTDALHLEVPAFPATPWELVYEHPSSFTPATLARTVRAAGFEPFDLSITFGGNFLRLDARRSDVPSEQHDIEAPEFLGTNMIADWNTRLDTMDNIAIWGAGTRGITFLNAIDYPEKIRYAVDLNPAKHGRFIAGTGHPIVSPDDFDAEHLIIMNPNYESEIRARLQSSPQIHVAD